MASVTKRSVVVPQHNWLKDWGHYIALAVAFLFMVFFLWIGWPRSSASRPTEQPPPPVTENAAASAVSTVVERTAFKPALSSAPTEEAQASPVQGEVSVPTPDPNKSLPPVVPTVFPDTPVEASKPEVQPPKEPVAEFDPEFLPSTIMWTEKQLQTLLSAGNSTSSEAADLRTALELEARQRLIGQEVTWGVPFHLKDDMRAWFPADFGQLRIETQQYNYLRPSAPNYLVVGEQILPEKFEALEPNSSLSLKGTILDVHLSENNQLVVFLGVGSFPDSWRRLPLEDRELVVTDLDRLNRWAQKISEPLVDLNTTRGQLTRPQLLKAKRDRDRTLEGLELAWRNAKAQSQGMNVSWRFQVEEIYPTELVLRGVTSTLPLRVRVVLGNNTRYSHDDIRTDPQNILRIPISSPLSPSLVKKGDTVLLKAKIYHFNWLPYLRTKGEFVLFIELEGAELWYSV